MSKKVLVALPPALLETVDYIAQVEHRTRSDLVREALRGYIFKFKAEQRSIGGKVALLTEAVPEPKQNTES